MTKKEYTKTYNRLNGNKRTVGLARLLKYLWEHENMTRTEGMRELGIANVPEAVRKLRMKGVPVLTDMVDGVNRYGEPVQYGEYSIPRRR